MEKTRIEKKRRLKYGCIYKLKFQTPPSKTRACRWYNKPTLLVCLACFLMFLSLYQLHTGSPRPPPLTRLSLLGTATDRLPHERHMHAARHSARDVHTTGDALDTPAIVIPTSTYAENEIISSDPGDNQNKNNEKSIDISKIQNDFNYNFTVSSDYIEDFFKGMRPVQSVSCKGLIEQDDNELGKAYVNMVTTNRSHATTDRDYLAMARNCTAFRQRRHYANVSFTFEEESFPIAFSIVAYKHVEQIERLLRLIYRPQNSYCIHLDAKASPQVVAAIRAIAACFPNVVMPEHPVAVEWGRYSVLEADLRCLSALWRFRKWKYWINLTGQELPLKTNLELVRILRTLKGANIVGGSRNRVRYINYRRYFFAGKPPHGLSIVKGPVHVVINRKFADFVLHDNRSLDYLEWLKRTTVPDESFFSTLNHNPHLGIPGSFLGDPEEYPEKPNIARFKNWRYPNGEWNRPCAGKYVHQICVFGVSDLHRLADTLGLFVNKVMLSYEHLTFDCLEEMIFNRTRDQYMNQEAIDLTVYEHMDQIKLRLKDEIDES